MLTDIEDSVSCFRKSALLSGSPKERVLSLLSLGSALRLRSEALGHGTDIAEAIMLSQEALSLVEIQDGVRRAACLLNIGTCFLRSYESSGRREELEKSIISSRGATTCTPTDDATLPAQIVSSEALLHLGSSLMRRFDSFGEPGDIEESAVCFIKSLVLCPGQRGRALALVGLCGAFTAKFIQSGDWEIGEESITRGREALTLIPPRHQLRPTVLLNLAGSLLVRRQPLELRGVDDIVTDLEESITFSREALSLLPESHHLVPQILATLGAALFVRSLSLGGMEDLDESTACLQKALSRLPKGNFYRAGILHCLALSLSEPRSITRSGPEEIEKLVLDSIRNPLASLVIRFRIASGWTRFTTDDAFRLRLYGDSLDLLQQVLLVNPGLEAQHRRLLTPGPGSHPRLASDAAAAAISANKLELAISMLEQGRTLILSNRHQHRTPTDELRSRNPDLGDNLDSVLRRMEELSASASVLLGDRSLGAGGWLRDSLLTSQNDLCAERDALLERIRRLVGFEDFLLPTPFDRLQMAANEGPIIILNACEKRCDALIVCSTGAPVLVPLPNATVAILSELINVSTPESVQPRRVANGFLARYSA